MINPSDTETLPPPAPSASSAIEEGEDRPRGMGTFAGRFTIPGDKINAATANLPDEQRHSIRWAAAYCRTKNLHVSEFAALLKKADGEPYSKDSIIHMFTGGRSESALVPMVDAIERLRKVEEARANLNRPPFVETRLAKRIFDVCRRAFLRQKLCFVFGDSQIGKSWALEEYERRNGKGTETIYVRVPTGGALCPFVRELSGVCGLGDRGGVEDLKRRIIDFFDSRMLLIVDEAEECLPDGRESSKGVNTLNFIREIHDKKKCGVVIAGAPILKKGLYLGRHSASMRRLVRRSLIPLQLPSIPSAADLATFAQHFELPPIPDEMLGIRFPTYDTEGNERLVKVAANPLELQGRIIREHGLGRWVMILTEASDTAKEKRRSVSWLHVIHAWQTFVTMETVDAEKEAA